MPRRGPHGQLSIERPRRVRHPTPLVPASSRGLPGGTLTFLFTDVEGSTRLWDLEPAAARVALARHDALIDACVQEHDGILVRPRGEGDSRFAVFRGAADAVAAAWAIQLAMQKQIWPTSMRVRVRIALHTGEADIREGDYYGGAVNRCARLRGISHAGQILVSGTTAALVRDGLPEGATLRDLGTYRFKDLADPERVFQLVHPDLPAQFPPLSSPNLVRNQLPLELASFIGRDRELLEVAKLMEHHRLVTISGPGGAGKTRLALQVARKVADRYADGVVLVELARVGDPTLVITATASSLDVHEQPGRPLEQTLVEYLWPNHVLLVLDNCEHVLQASAELVDHVLTRTPDVHVLATTRQALGVPSETISRLGPLELPSEQSTGVTEIGRYAAVQLFDERARAIAPGFTLTDDNAASVSLICRSLDGLPLALELAAAHIASATPQQIAAHLDDRFRLLVGGPRTAPPRQQALRTTIDWSYSLLADAERTVFRRMAVFTGGCTLEAAQAVCGGDAAPFMNLVGGLVDKSLCVVSGVAEGAVRYDMLESLRQYGGERLIEAGELDAARRAHAAFYLGLAQRASPELTRRNQVQWLERLEREYDNLRVALSWAFGEGEAHIAMQFGAALWRFWRYRGHLSEATGWIKRLLPLPMPQTDARQQVLFGAGILAIRTGMRDEAWEHFEELRKAGPQIHVDVRSGALIQLGHLALARGNLAEAEQFYREALGICRDESLTWNGVVALLGLAGVELRRHEFAVARQLCEQALALSSELGDRMLLTDVHQRLGMIDLLEGKFAGAGDQFATAMQLSLDFGNLEGQIESLEFVGRHAVACERWVRALRLFGAAEAHREALGFGPFDAFIRQAVVRARQAAGASAEDAWAAGRKLSLSQAVAEGLLVENS
jgi:predicted ATPase/class 3 adenylate cyclase